MQSCDTLRDNKQCFAHGGLSEIIAVKNNFCRLSLSNMYKGCESFQKNGVFG